MVDEEVQDDFDLGDEKKSNKKLFIIGGAVFALLLAVGSALYFLGIFPSDDQGEEPASGEMVTEEVDETSDIEATKSPAIYFDLQPNFIVNFSKSDVRLLQVSIAVMSRQQESIDVVTKHLPRIRNNLLLLMADEKPEKLKTLKGKEALRKKLLTEIQKIVEEEAAIKEGVEGLFFTGFVLQ